MTDADLIETLREEIVQLRRQLGVEADHAVLAAFQEHLGVASGAMSLILAALYRAGPSWVTLERLDLAAPPPDHASSRQLKSIQVYICNLRKVIGQDAIIGVVGRGYTLSATGVALCRRAIELSKTQTAIAA